jgi:two-component system, NtrC family, nitrogen regulation response regulator GlnG
MTDTRQAIVWVVDDDRSIRWVLDKALSQVGFRVSHFERADLVLQALENGQIPHALISDIRMPGIDGLDLLARLNQMHPEVPVIIMTAYSDLDSTVAAYQSGAFEYLSKPFDVDEAVALVKRALAQNPRAQAPSPNEIQQSSDIIGSAPAMQEVFRAIGRLSRAHITVLITGESGTGKELVAHALHRHSPRANGPFIALNTAALPRELLESELFGHERGAFTGALSQRRGRFEQADGGTLFLDEIGDMPADLQTRLLRVLADGTFFRVGGHTPIKVDVRIIAATHQNLQTRVREGKFREDLYHRLNVIHIHLPSLRQRRSDIPVLARHFLHQAAREAQEEAKVLTPASAACLSSLDWPGNVRQLENVCRWLSVMAPGQEIHPSALPPDLLAQSTEEDSATSWEDSLRQWCMHALHNGQTDLLGAALPKFERVLIETALHHSHSHRQEAARLLGWGRNTLTRKIKELGMAESEDGIKEEEK